MTSKKHCTCQTTGRDTCEYHEYYRQKQREYREKYPEKAREAVKRCKEKYPEKYAERSRRWYYANKDKYEARKADGRIRNSRLKHQYGITEADYQQMLAAQSGKCAICPAQRSRSSVNLCVDHNATTGEVRGLLCDECNLLIGYAGHSADRLRKAIAYLGGDAQSISRIFDPTV